jgi:hypothetical protein
MSTPADKLDLLESDHEQPGSDLGAITDLINPPAEEPKSGQDAVTDDELIDPDAEELTPEPENPEPLEIDYDQVVPVKVGSEAEELTIGQLKDHYQESRQFHQERDSWESVRMDQQNENLVARQQVVELVQLLGDVNPELITRLNSQREAAGKQQAELLIQTFPEWQDADIKARDRVGLLETWKALGFSDTEFGTLLTDHRMVKGLSDLAKFRARERKAQEAKPTIPKGQKPKGRKRTQAQEVAQATKRAADGSPEEKNQAIGRLIDGA